MEDSGEFSTHWVLFLTIAQFFPRWEKILLLSQFSTHWGENLVLVKVAPVRHSKPNERPPVFPETISRLALII